MRSVVKTLCSLVLALALVCSLCPVAGAYDLPEETVNENGAELAQKYQVLFDEILPGAVEVLLDAFPLFRQAAQQGRVSRELGFQAYYDGQTSIAMLETTFTNLEGNGWGSSYAVPVRHESIRFAMRVNTYFFSDTIDIGHGTRRLVLESTMLHELMHAFMNDLLIAGMIGVDANGYEDNEEQLYIWFREGMAQTVCGGADQRNNVLEKMGLTAESTKAQISAVLTSRAHSIGPPGYSGTMTAKYGTGYLACMYLGYLAAGSPKDFTPAQIAGGLDRLMTMLAEGYSLDSAIACISNYQGMNDFRDHLPFDDGPLDFIVSLLGKIGTTGSGSVLGESFLDGDFIDDKPYEKKYYVIDPNRKEVYSSANGVRDWEGGRQHLNGKNYDPAPPEITGSMAGESLHAALTGQLPAGARLLAGRYAAGRLVEVRLLPAAKGTVDTGLVPQAGERCRLFLLDGNGRPICRSWSSSP